MTPEDALRHLERHAAVVASKLGCDIFLVNSDIEDSTLERLRDFLIDPARKAHGYLVLVTRGGSPHAAFRIGRALQRAFQKVTICVPSMCKSAGTLIAGAAHELVIDDRGELGPLDVQMPKVGEIMDFTSASVLFDSLRTLHRVTREAFSDQLVLMTAGSGITAAAAAPIAAQMTADLYSGIMARIDPHHLGEVARSNEITLRYMKRLGVLSKNITVKSCKRLVETYPDHGYVIDREEANELFANVRAPTEEEQVLLAALNQLAYSHEFGRKAPGGGIVTRLAPSRYFGDTGSRDDDDNDDAADDANEFAGDSGSGQEAPTQADQSEGTEPDHSGGNDPYLAEELPDEPDGVADAGDAAADE